ncbi:MAG TPA: phospho-N-acetylmuramoyl-pentapeptide-transferase [Candidatus Gracilibacteria bacterium]
MSILTANLIQISFFSLLAFIIAVGTYPPFIEMIAKFKLTKKIREESMDGKKAKIFARLHAHKSGTPTMGGAVIVFAVLITVIISRVLSYYGIVESSLLNRGETYLPIATLAGAGILGLVDDYLNIIESGKQKGLSARVKMISLLAMAGLGALWFAFKLEWSTIHLPGIGNFDIGLWYIPLFMFVFVGTANAVNFTDGLDGLAGGLLAICFTVMAAIAYFYELPILATFCCVIVAAIAGFLWFNVPPAKIYMGDAGSMALGATLGVIAMLTNAVVVLAIISVIFILETISVILQLFWKKHFKRKLFLVAPIHHHFEALGWSETQIVMRFWMIGAIAGVIGLLLGLITIDGGLF